MHFYSGPPMHFYSGVDTRFAISNSDLAITSPYQVQPSLLWRRIAAGSDAPLFSRPVRTYGKPCPWRCMKLPHGFPLVQCGPLVSLLPLRQVLMNCFRASPVMPLAWVQIETIRYYERIGLLPKARREQGGRFLRYDGNNLARLRFTRRARQLGFTLDEIRGLLRLAVTDDEHARSEARNLTSAHIADIRTKIAVLQAMGF